jgi:hypothetical protein
MNTLFLGVIDVNDNTLHAVYLPDKSRTLKALNQINSVKNRKWIIKVLLSKDISQTEKNYSLEMRAIHEMATPKNQLNNNLHQEGMVSSLSGCLMGWK